MIISYGIVEALDAGNSLMGLMGVQHCREHVKAFPSARDQRAFKATVRAWPKKPAEYSQLVHAKVASTPMQVNSIDLQD